MSETTEQQAPEAQSEVAADVATEEHQQPETDWKAEAERLRKNLQEARKWEQRAKSNRDELDQLKATATDAEQASSELASLKQQMTELKAANDRKDVAIEFKLSKEDAVLLSAVTDVEAMRTIADRLSKKPTGYVPNEGTQSPAPEDEARMFVRRLAGSE